MTAQIIDGKAVSQKCLDKIAAEVAQRTAENKRPPCLAVILIGDNPASQVYVRNKKNACEKVGFRSLSYEKSADFS